jgi:DNA (cytosine-5)-methyltransferase 1
MKKHLDLFSGIGGFALAADWAFGEVEHTFVEIDLFCQEVLKKHWPKAKIYGDIRTITADTYSIGHVHRGYKKQSTESSYKTQRKPLTGIESPFILTGGFPCQPFSQAGRRKGTTDDRHLWPEMLRVIRLTTPHWIIATLSSG